MITKIVLITVGILILTLTIYLMRRFIMFLVGLILLVGGSGGAIFGFLLMVINKFYLTGGGLLIFTTLLAFFGWELVAKSSEVKVPDYASEASSSYDQVHVHQAGRNLYDRHSGSSFGSGF